MNITAGLPRAGHLLSASRRSQIPRRGRAELPDGHGPLRPVARRRVRRPMKTAARVFGDPRQGFETCSIVEFMHSFEMLTRISGDAGLGRSLRGYRLQLPAGRADAGLESACTISPRRTRCSSTRGTSPPAFKTAARCSPTARSRSIAAASTMCRTAGRIIAEELWLATADGGLCASLYAAIQVTAKVGDGASVTIAEETDYPFDGKIKFRVGGEEAGPLSAVSANPALVPRSAVSIVVPTKNGSGFHSINLDRSVRQRSSVRRCRSPVDRRRHGRVELCR